MTKFNYVAKKKKNYADSYREGTFHTLEDICQIKGDGRTFHTDEARRKFVEGKLGLEVIHDEGEEGVVIMDMPQGRRRVRYGIQHAAEKGTHSEFDKKNKDEQIGAPPLTISSRTVHAHRTGRKSQCYCRRQYGLFIRASDNDLDVPFWLDMPNHDPNSCYACYKVLANILTIVCV